MAKIHSLAINNFRGIKQFNHVFSSDFICLIGRGDSGKSTILEAISSVLSSSWILPFYDNDFHDCDTANPIIIEATIKDIPKELISEDKFGLYLRGIDANNNLTDDIEESKEEVLTIRLEIHADLEPLWSVITEREVGNKNISASDRSKLNVFLVSDYIDRHFSWSKGSPLYSLLKQELQDDNDNSMIEAFREAKTKIDGIDFKKFDNVTAKVKASASHLGINISKTISTIDFKDIVIKDGKLCLHDKNIPFRLKGKGAKRLVSMAIQAAVADEGGIILIDEIEQGLEPDRVQSLVSTLKSNNKGQIFITTHSRDVLVELVATDIQLVREKAKSLLSLNSSLQALVRRNPEAFFAKKVAVCEGPTEMGICRALNEYRVLNNKENSAYLGVRFADGTGETIISYSEGFIESGYDTCLFCDSDVESINKSKPALKLKGIEIVDWADSDSLELGIFKEVPFSTLLKIFDLAAFLYHKDDSSSTLSEYKSQLWDSVKAYYGKDCPDKIENASDTGALRIALATSAQKKGWFKRQDKAFRLGKVIFEDFEQISEESLLKKNLLTLSKWIDK